MGRVLEASEGVWYGPPDTTFQYQWSKCDGYGCADIPTANTAYYAPTPADVGAQLFVTVTPLSVLHQADAVISSPTARVSDAGGSFYPPENVTPPVLSGTAVAGQTLSTTDGYWQGTQPITISRSWERCGITNLIPSGSFESDASGWATASNYAISPSGGTLTRTTEQRYAGSYSLKDSTAGVNFGEGVAYTGVAVRLT